MISIITGGARSGKSSFAEKLYQDKKDVVYIATSRLEAGDLEMEDRIKKHRQARPDYWRTYEGFTDLDQALGSEDYYLLDCITNMISNIMFEMTLGLTLIDDEKQKEVEDRVLLEMEKLIGAIRRENKQLLIVTNEVGSSTVPENHLVRVFRDIQGRVNQRLAVLADQAYIVVMGIPVSLK